MQDLYKNVIIAFVFNGLDILVGVITAVKLKNLQSSRLRDGLFKKTGFLICYFLAGLVDAYGRNIGFSPGVKILPAVIGYVCLTEVVSILENVMKLNPDILPDKIMEIFQIKL